MSRPGDAAVDKMRAVFGVATDVELADATPPLFSRIAPISLMGESR